VGVVNQTVAANPSVLIATIRSIRIFGPVTFPWIDIPTGLGENGGGIPGLSSFRHVMTLRSATKVLLTFALGLPIIQTVLSWVAGLLRTMGDQAGATIIRGVGSGCQVVWAITLVGLVIVLALQTLNDRPENGE
jgi:hypothetical protein